MFSEIFVKNIQLRKVILMLEHGTFSHKKGKINLKVLWELQLL